MGRGRILHIIIVFTLVFAVAGTYGAYLDVRRDTQAYEEEPFFFELSHSGMKDTIIPWQKSRGEFILFLPSYASLSELSLSSGSMQRIIFDGRPLKAGGSFEGVSFNRPYSIRFSDMDSTITFRRSANVATVFVNVKDEFYFNSLDKDRKEKATANFIDESGANSTGELSAKIKGHGNSTWEADKKPYQLKLDKGRSILGMDKAKKWLLIANAYDATNMRNKITYDLAGKLFNEWSPKGEFADVYLNGRYSGLYLITEKVEEGDNRLPKTSKCLLTQETLRRGERDQEYVTDRDVAMEIVEPENCYDTSYDEIASAIQEMEDSFFLPGTEWKSYIDMDSWVKRYLIDEFSGNFDANKLSSFLYALEEDGRYRFYGGPVWDYDKAYMQEDSSDTPYLFAAAAEYRRRNIWTPYYRVLLDKPAFREHVKKVYQNELRPLLKKLQKRDFDELSIRINQASVNNFARCKPFVPPVGYTHDTLESAIAAVKEYIDARIRIMDDKWLRDANYHIVGIEPAVKGKIREYEVLDGEEFDHFPDAEYYDIALPVWYDMNTGEEYDSPFVVTGDMYLFLKDQPKETR